MTFLNPLVLLGLAAAAIPLILHLLNLRKLRTIEFSSVRFLHELQKTRIRRLRIRQWLLLLLRTLLVVFLVLAFARPAFRGSVAGIVGGRAATTMILIIDDSPSMSVRSDQGELFASAKRSAATLLTLAKPGDQIFVLPLSRVRKPEAARSAVAGEFAPDITGRMEISHETVPYLDAVLAAARIARRSSNANKELFLIGDGQASQFQARATLADSTLPSDIDLKLFILEVPHHPPENTAVQAVTLKSRIVTRGRPLALGAEVRRYGSTPVRDEVVSAYLGGSRVAQRTLDLPAGSMLPVDFAVVPKISGIVEGYVQLEEDPLEDDNRRYFVIDVPDTVNVLLLGGDRNDTRLASLALLPGRDSSLSALFRVRSATEDQIASVDFGTIDVAVLCGIRDFTPLEAERIAQFVRAGGGLMVFPGPVSDIANYNSTLFSRLGIPPAIPAGPLGTRPDSSAATISFDRIDFAHPVFSDLFEQSSTPGRSTPAIESPAIRRSMGIMAGERGRTIISLPDGRGFLDEFDPGNGRMFIFAVDAGLAWSDFALKGIFAPLLHRSIMYLTAPEGAERSFTAGDRLEIHPKAARTGDAETFIIRTPSGVEVRVAPERSSLHGLTSFGFSDSHEPGIYELRRTDAAGSGRRIGAVAVNVDSAESDLRMAADDALQAFRERARIERDHFRILTTDEPITEEVEKSRYGIELWRYFLALALLMGLAEMAVGKAPAEASPSEQEVRGQ